MEVRYMRDQAPSSYLLTIKPFSELLKMKRDYYVSSIFEASGYKWRLIFYQRGNFRKGGKDHISMYVRLEYSDSLPSSGKINVELKLFIKNQTQNKFLTVQYCDVKRIGRQDGDLGFIKMLPISIFDDSRNGYLINDSCVVGAEICIIEPFDKQENLTFLRNPTEAKFIWKICKFSKLDKKKYESDEYVMGEKKWKIWIFPEGDVDLFPTANSLAFQLWGIGRDEDKEKAYIWVRSKVRLLDQINSKHIEREYCSYYSPAGSEGFLVNIITLKELNDPSRGFLVNDKLIFEVDTEFMTITDVVPV